MILRLNNSHRKVYDAIQKHGKAITCIELHEMLKINILSLTQYLATLKKEGFIKATSRGKKNYYTVTNNDYDELKAEIVKRNEAIKASQEKAVLQGEALEDPVLEEMKTYELSDKDWKFILENKHMKRTELAEKLGINKLQLTIGIHKRKKSK